MRLIDAEKLWMVTEGKHEYYERFEIDEAPTVDAVPVKHGRWLWNKYNGIIGNYHCSECLKICDSEYDYCPNCGARMDEE